MSETHPRISEFLTCHGLCQLLDTILYCSITAWNSSKEVVLHDSMLLWKLGGIHPLATLACAIALPLAELALFAYLRGRKSPRI